MNAQAKLLEKYATTQPAPEPPQPAAEPAAPAPLGQVGQDRYLGAPCRSCGSREYRLAPSKLWACRTCGSYFLEIDGLAGLRRVHRIPGRRNYPCVACNGLAFLQALPAGGLYCLTCQRSVLSGRVLEDGGELQLAVAAEPV